MKFARFITVSQNMINFLMHPPPTIFNVIFDEYKFSIISILFDGNDPYVLSMLKSKICKQNLSYLVNDSELEAKKQNKICHKN